MKAGHLVALMVASMADQSVVTTVARSVGSMAVSKVDAWAVMKVAYSVLTMVDD